MSLFGQFTFIFVKKKKVHKLNTLKNWEITSVLEMLGRILDHDYCNLLAFSFII